MTTDPILDLDPFDVRLLELDDWSLLRHLGRPTHLRLPGTGDGPARAIVTLQHGDEPTGLQALLRVLRRRPRLPYDLHVVIGNVAAALEPPGFAHRFLPGQRDMNRLWSADASDGPQAAAVAALRARLRAQPLDSVLDLHNTSGANPFHAITVTPDRDPLELATRFTTTVVLWEQRVHALLEALADHCPTVAVECGLAGRPASLAFALDGVRRHLAAPPLGGGDLPDHDLLHRMRRVLVDPRARVRFGGTLDDEVDLVIDVDADHRNGVPTPAGWVLGWVRPDAPFPLRVLDHEDHDVTTSVLMATATGEVLVMLDATPLMMTRTVEAARKDCLTYLVTPWAASHASTSSPANRSSSGGTAQTTLARSSKAS